MALNKLLLQGWLFDPVKKPGKIGDCERCSFNTGLFWSPTGSVAENAHPGHWLCGGCDEEYQEDWKEMWDEYHAGLL